MSKDILYLTFKENFLDPSYCLYIFNFSNISIRLFSWKPGNNKCTNIKHVSWINIKILFTNFKKNTWNNDDLG